MPDLNKKLHSHRFIVEPADPQRLAALCGQFNEHLKQIEQRLGLSINQRSDRFELIGDSLSVIKAQAVLSELYAETAENRLLTPDQVHLTLQQTLQHSFDNIENHHSMSKREVVSTRKGSVKGRGQNQDAYIRAIQEHDITFGIGPAGTGKTYLAVACAAQALEQEIIQRILLVRPAVEAGEKLGFLPGDLAQKIDPYLRPLYDALYELVGFDRTCKLIEQNVIEVAPLAYMRGRTLNHSFIILDESQNTTIAQMKMFLTRIGFGSRAVITGDITQVDLPKNVRSGLSHSVEVLDKLKGISIMHFNSGDVVRHPVVQKIVEAYERFDERQLHLSSSVKSMDKS